MPRAAPSAATGPGPGSPLGPGAAKQLAGGGAQRATVDAGSRSPKAPPPPARPRGAATEEPPPPTMRRPFPPRSPFLPHRPEGNAPPTAPLRARTSPAGQHRRCPPTLVPFSPSRRRSARAARGPQPAVLPAGPGKLRHSLREPHGAAPAAPTAARPSPPGPSRSPGACRGPSPGPPSPACPSSSPRPPMRMRRRSAAPPQPVAEKPSGRQGLAAGRSGRAAAERARERGAARRYSLTAPASECIFVRRTHGPARPGSRCPSPNHRAQARPPPPRPPAVPIGSGCSGFCSPIASGSRHSPSACPVPPPSPALALPLGLRPSQPRLPLLRLDVTAGNLFWS